MQFTVRTTQLREALSKVVNLVEKKTTRPILSYTKFRIGNESIDISATDLELSAKFVIHTSNNVQGEFCLNGKNLFEILQVLPDGEILFEINDENTLFLSLGEIKYKLLIYKSDDFPHLTFENVENSFLLPANHINTIVNKTAFAVSQDETRLYFSGIFLQDIEGQLRSVACDGHRLSLLDTKVPLENITPLINGIIIPKRGISELKKLADSYSDLEVKMSVDESFIYFSANNEYFFSIRLIAREYPNYQTVIPTKFAQTVRIDKNKFLDAVKRIKIMSHEKTNAVKIKLQNEEMLLSANHPSLGDAFEKIPLEFSGKQIEFGFNAKYLIDGLNAIDGEELILDYNNELTPVIIRSDKHSEYLGMIMPLRL